jgi:hypothetical protein
MNETHLLRAIGEADDRFIAEAAPAARKQPTVVWLRWAAAACACLAIFGAIMATRGPTTEPIVPTHDWSQIQPFPRDPDGKILPGPKTQPSGEEMRVDTFAEACYIKGYSTVEELLEDAALIVRATPVFIEGESDVGICWVLDVAEASDGTTKTVKLRQVKDEFMLRMGQEVVLVLENDASPGYYHIPGGGDGLFRVNPVTGKADGKLLVSLLKLDPAYSGAGSLGSMTAQDVYDRLVAAYKNQ